MTTLTDRPRLVEAAPEVEDLRRTSGRTREDLYTLVGAAAASIATTWLFYTCLLYTSDAADE